MRYLDAVIGPGPWLQEEPMMEPATFAFFSWLFIFCFIAVILTIVALLIVMWVRSGNEKAEEDSDSENCKTEEP